MAYIKELNAYVNLWERSLKMRCCNCGKTFSDGRGTASDAVLFKRTGVETDIHCDNCDKTVFDFTFWAVPYCQDIAMEEFEAHSVKDAGVLDEEDEQMDSVSE